MLGASGNSMCPLQLGYCVGATCSCMWAERGVQVQAQQGEGAPSEISFLHVIPTPKSQCVRQLALTRMRHTLQLGAGSSACAPPDTHTKPHSFCPWGGEGGKGRQRHPYQEALLAESHLAVGWLSQQLQQQG